MNRMENDVRGYLVVYRRGLGVLKVEGHRVQGFAYLGFRGLAGQFVSRPQPFLVVQTDVASGSEFFQGLWG